MSNPTDSGFATIDKNGIVQWDTAESAGFKAFEVCYVTHVTTVTALALDPEKQHLLAPAVLANSTFLDGINWPTPVKFTVVGDEEGTTPFGRQEKFQKAEIKYSGLICIDGPDASGKTTLANKIAEMTNGEVIHLTWTAQLAKVMNRYRCSAIEYAAMLAHDRVVVLERPWLCNLVYSNVYRGGKYNYHDVLRWKQLCEEHEVLSIVALPSDPEKAVDLYTKMCTEREELHGSNREKMLAVHAQFANVVKGLHPAFEPATHPDAKFEIYDYQAFPSMVGDFVANNVLPYLKTRS